MSERRACVMIGIWRMTVRYRSQRPDDGRLRERLKALAAPGNAALVADTSLSGMRVARELDYLIAARGRR